MICQNYRLLTCLLQNDTYFMRCIVSLIARYFNNQSEYFNRYGKIESLFPVCIFINFIKIIGRKSILFLYFSLYLVFSWTQLLTCNDVVGVQGPLLLDLHTGEVATMTFKW